MLGLYPFASTNIDSFGNSFHWQANNETGTPTDSLDPSGSTYLVTLDTSATMTVTIGMSPQFIDYLEDVSISATDAVTFGASNYLAGLSESGFGDTAVVGNIYYSLDTISDSLIAADTQTYEGSQLPVSIDVSMTVSEEWGGIFLLNRDVADSSAAQESLTNVMTMPMNVTDINTAQAPITGNLAIPAAITNMVTISTSWVGRNLWEAIDTGPHSGWVLVNTQ